MQTFSIMAAPAPQLLRDYLTYMSTIKGPPIPALSNGHSQWHSPTHG